MVKVGEVVHVFEVDEVGEFGEAVYVGRVG